MTASLNNLIYLQAGDWEAYVLPAFGSNLIRLACQGREILRTPPDLSALVASPVLYGMPLLMPPNRTANGRFCFAGRTYQLPVNENTYHNHLHGHFYAAPFCVEARSAHAVTCSLVNDADLFPSPCRLVCDISLSAAGLVHHLTVENTGESDMPLVVGYHTNFMKPPCFCVPIFRRWETDHHYIPTGTLLELNEREQLYRSGFTPDDQRISGFFQAAGRTARIGPVNYTVSEPFDQWILYNGDGKQDFLSVEPQIGPVDSLNRPGSYPVLKPKQAITLVSSISCH